MYAPGRRWRPQEKTTNPSNNHLTIKKEYFIMKKVISLVLSVMMMLTMFAGCKASTTAETAAPTAAPTSAATAETAADTSRPTGAAPCRYLLPPAGAHPRLPGDPPGAPPHLTLPPEMQRNGRQTVPPADRQTGCRAVFFLYPCKHRPGWPELAFGASLRLPPLPVK